MTPDVVSRAQPGRSNYAQAAAPCPHCHAGIGEPCRTPAGRAIPPHRQRGAAAPTAATRHALGCRCCRACTARTQRAARRSRPTPTHVHGKATGYRDYGCRCDPCKAAVAVESADYRARRVAAGRLPTAPVPRLNDPAPTAYGRVERVLEPAQPHLVAEARAAEAARHRRPLSRRTAA